MWTKKWYLKRNISFDAHLLNELLETDVPWDDAIVVSAAKLEETVGFPEWTAQFRVWKTTGKDSSEACAIAGQNCAVYSVFPSGMTSYSKIAQLNWERIGRLKSIQHVAAPRKHPLRTYLAVSWFTRFDAAVVDKSIKAAKSNETTTLLDEIDASSSAICSKQDYIAHQYVQKQDRQNSASARPFACHINQPLRFCAIRSWSSGTWRCIGG
jgi:hypothetical protein